MAEERPEKYGKWLIGRTDMEDALKRLDKLTREEAWVVIAENLRAIDQVKRSSFLDLINADYRSSCIISENQLRESIHRWLSPPDPSTNHNIACGAHHENTAKWFFEGNVYREWKTEGSILWVHGKRTPCPNFPSYTL
jgi:hypothetical protein